MKTSNILLLALVGGAMYYFYKKSKEAQTTTEPKVLTDYAPGGDGGGMEMRLPESVVPFNDLGLPQQVNERTGQAIEQTLDANGKSINTAYQVRFAIKGIPNII